jgi:hypothetical protein
MSYTSNINEVIKGLEHKIGHLPLGEITVAVGQSLLASNIERIHEKGKAVDGGNIGQYDTSSPMYINPNKAPRKAGLVPPKGKNGETKFKNGKPHKTTYVNSYKDYRGRVGRKTDKVNLNLTGKLQSELNLVVVNNKADIGFISSYGGTISEAMEDKYGKKIWGVSKEDKKDIQNIVTEIVLREINE